MVRDGQLSENCLVRREDDTRWVQFSSVIARLATAEEKEDLRELGIPITRGLTSEQVKTIIQTAIATDKEKAQLWMLWTALLRKATEIRLAAEASGKSSVVSDFYLKLFLAGEQRENPKGFCDLDASLLLTRYIIWREPAWRNEIATDRQRKLLESKGIKVPAGLTKGDASDQIDSLLHGITEGQKRRLTFYQISSVGLTKEEASDLIDRYVAEHPEAEQQYQDWKAKELRSHPPHSMSQEEWEDALEEIEKQSVAVKMILPASGPGDEMASIKQLQYIRSLVREIDEVQLQALTKVQARAVIEEITKQKTSLSKETAQRLLAKHASAEKVITGKTVALVAVLVIIVVIIVCVVLS
jgi:hypothetical protein